MKKKRYAAAGKWEERDEVRRHMDRLGIKKIPGQSSIEIDGKIHNFVMRDELHKGIPEIYSKVKLMQEEYPCYFIFLKYLTFILLKMLDILLIHRGCYVM